MKGLIFLSSLLFFRIFLANFVYLLFNMNFRISSPSFQTWLGALNWDCIKLVD